MRSWNRYSKYIQLFLFGFAMTIDRAVRSHRHCVRSRHGSSSGRPSEGAGRD